MTYGRKKQVQTFTGSAELRYSGFKGQVSYEVAGDPATLKPGRVSLRGAVIASPETVAALFRAGEGTLTLENRQPARITMLGHTPGGDTAYFEMRM